MREHMSNTIHTNANVDLDYETIKSELEKLKSAIHTFEPYSKNFITNTMNVLDGMHSDFTSKMKGALDNMRDTKAPKLITDLNLYQAAVKEAMDLFQQLDQSYSTSLESAEVKESGNQ